MQAAELGPSVPDPAAAARLVQEFIAYRRRALGCRYCRMLVTSLRMLGSPAINVAA